MSLSVVLILFLASCLSGLIGSLVGLGGGIVLVPVLTLYVGVPLKTAIAASIFIVIANSTMVSIDRVAKGQVRIPLATNLELLTVCFAVVGALVALAMPVAALSKVFAVMAVLMATLMFLRRPEAADEREPTPAGLGGLSVATAVAGMFSGMLGVGGGVIIVPALTVVGQLPVKHATATSSFMMGMTGAGSAFIYLTRGQVDSWLTAWCVLGSLLGAMLGNAWSHRLDPKHLRWIFSLVVAVLGVRMWLK